MYHSNDSGVGPRLARARKRRGLTQVALSQLSHYSRSHIAQVERGTKAATPAFVNAAAAALSVDPAELYGQPYRGENPANDRVHATIAEIRRALIWVDIPPDLDAPPQDLNRLAAELASCQRLRRATHHTRLGARLPALIEELTHHTHTTASPRAWWLLFATLETAGELTRRLGYTDLVGQLLERSAVAATQAQDPVLPLMVTRRRALLSSALETDTAALRMLTAATDRIDPDHPGAEEASGSLHLRAAVVAARTGDASRAWDHYAHAQQVSRRVGYRPLDRYATNFVPGNIAIHGSAIAVELADWDEASRRASEVTDTVLAGVSTERRAHHRVDTARAHLETGHRDAALADLLTADRTAPQMVRFHPTARITATHLASRYRDLPEALRILISRMRL